MPNHAINADVQKRRFALLLHAGYGERSRALCAREPLVRADTATRGFARVSLRALRALRPYAGAAQLAPR
ncbi:hypothetical protein [Acidithiobacillus ferriphilus]|uniref:hypothetical protein n=1 Tax=Acidithiobacillus ferriphilus TaxID=1689834 RepID=UPI001E48E041|nr:hypothetical protein [Acidithiobacillus ferriphilus]UEP58568.1 hypothetical protein K1Y48_09585 [Acidithiobacillus ferriphilus]